MSSVSVVLLALSALSLQSCATHNPKLWIGSAERQSVRDSQGQQIQCSEPQFDKMVCMTPQDFQYLIQSFDKGSCVWDRGRLSR